MSLPSIYQDAAGVGVTPVDPVRQRFGVSFDTSGGRIRMALTIDDFRLMVRAVEGYVNLTLSGDNASTLVTPAQ